jgi:hypothetical protein
MEARTVKHLVAALGTMFLCAAPAASGAMYKWTDADGTVNYSNQPPAEPDKVRSLTQAESTSARPVEEHRNETQAAPKEKTSGDSAIGAAVTATPKTEPSPVTAVPRTTAPEPALVKPDPLLARPDPLLARPEPRPGKPAPSLAIPDPTLPKSEPALTKTEPTLMRPGPPPTLSEPTLRSESATLSPENDSLKRESDSAQRAPTRGLKEAARDPCLRSSDRNCYQRNKDRYHPYLGYAPAVTEPGSTPPVGATSTVGGVGVVSGHVGTPAVSATPRRIETPLIFFDQPPTKKRRSR